jgi:hypothetical protein
MSDLKLGLRRYFEFYNAERFHASMDYAMPNVINDSRFANEQRAFVPLHKTNRTGLSTLNI